MKKVILAFAALLVAVSSMAQGYNRVSFTGSPTQLKSGSEKDAMGGYTLAYTRGIPIAADALFLEVGLAANLIHDGQSSSLTVGKYSSSASYSFTMFRMLVPVNLTYKIAIGGNAALAPFAGINLTGNLSGKYKESAGGISATQDMFSNNSGAKRIQLGYQVGLGLDLGSFYAGLGYSGDITSLSSNGEAKFNGFMFTIGYNF